MRRVEFNDGEGIDPADFNVAAKLADRLLHRTLIYPRLVEGWGSQLVLARGSTFGLGGTGGRTITLADGVYAEAATPATDDDPEVAIGEYVGAAYVLDANTDGSSWRRDILQAQITAEETGEPETRDFEDAATRALTTTSPNKRRLRFVDIQVKKGTDQANEAAADANEPAPDSGYTKIYSVLVDNTGTADPAKVWDWHTPWDYFRDLVTAAEMGPVSGTVPDLRADVDRGDYWQWINGDGNGTVMARALRSLDSGGIRFARLLSIDYFAAPADGSSGLDVRIRRPSNTVSTIIDTIAPTPLAAAALQTHTPAKPIWTNGYPSRRLGMGNEPIMVSWQDQGDASSAGTLSWLKFIWGRL